MIFARVVSSRALNALIGSSPVEPSSGVSEAASGWDIVTERRRDACITISTNFEVVAEPVDSSTFGPVSLPVGYRQASSER
jgi:hypothetical protein